MNTRRSRLHKRHQSIRFAITHKPDPAVFRKIDMVAAVLRNDVDRAEMRDRWVRIAQLIDENAGFPAADHLG